MEKKTPKLRLIQGGKRESQYSVTVDLALIIFGVLFLAVLLYKAA